MAQCNLKQNALGPALFETSSVVWVWCSQHWVHFESVYWCKCVVTKSRDSGIDPHIVDYLVIMWSYITTYISYKSSTRHQRYKAPACWRWSHLGPLCTYLMRCSSLIELIQSLTQKNFLAKRKKDFEKIFQEVMYLINHRSRQRTDGLRDECNYYSLHSVLQQDRISQKKHKPDMGLNNSQIMRVIPCTMWYCFDKVNFLSILQGKHTKRSLFFIKYCPVLYFHICCVIWYIHLYWNVL